jgi:hypothetical protein
MQENKMKVGTRIVLRGIIKEGMNGKSGIITRVSSAFSNMIRKEQKDDGLLHFMTALLLRKYPYPRKSA